MIQCKIMSSDAIATELERVQLNPAEVHFLRGVYHSLIDPVFAKLDAISGDKTIHVNAAKRLMFYVATLVEGARDNLLQAQKQEQTLEFKGIHDLKKLMVYIPSERKYDDVRKQLAVASITTDQSPFELMNVLGLNIDAGRDTIDGRLVFGFSPQQSVEYSVIYMDADVYPDAPTAPYTTPPYMSQAIK